MKRQIKPDRLLSELQDVAERLFSEIRYEQGTFQTGTCMLKGKKILVVNKRQPIDERIAALASEIAREGTNNLYIKPVVRAEIERFNNNDIAEDSI